MRCPNGTRKKGDICVKKPKVAIIIPFRDDKSQVRTKQLNKLLLHFNSFFAKSTYYKVFIIEQSTDNKKFNRGKLLNIGFTIADNLGFNLFIFHDVDLLPSIELRRYYSRLTENPIHIAKMWNRYSSNPAYFGGVVAFNKPDFEKINGFPNNFWGWGGEDDELFLRTKENNIEIIAPNKGTYTDLENMNIKEKVAYLKKNMHIKNMKKYELLDPNYRNKSWKYNGLYNLKYALLSEMTISPFAIKITVQL
jgi:hypothetical protein